MPSTTISFNLQNGPESVRFIDCGSSSPKLGGTINLTPFTNLESFTCIDNDVTSITGIDNLLQLKTLDIQSNLLTGPVPDLTLLTNLETLRININSFAGSAPVFRTNTKLIAVDFSNNLSITGDFPDISNNIELIEFNCGNCRLSGPFPSLSNNPNLDTLLCNRNLTLNGVLPDLSSNANLRVFGCHNNNFTGSIPALPPSIEVFNCGLNNITGSIPNLSAYPLLRQFSCNNNKITGFQGGTISNRLVVFQAQNNLLTQSAVNSILASFVAVSGTVVPGSINLGGTGNAAPTGQGIIDKAILQSRGWTVTTR